MRPFILAILAAFSLGFSGCVSTELLEVDKYTARKSGIPITYFEDNPIYAHIMYDYSKIPNFDKSKVKVYLRRSLKKFPPSTFEAHYITRMSVEGNPEWTRLTIPSYANALPKFFRKKKKVIVLKHKPGYMKILAIDDIGTYVIYYDK